MHQTPQKTVSIVDIGVPANVTMYEKSFNNIDKMDKKRLMSSDNRATEP